MSAVFKEYGTIRSADVVRHERAGLQLVFSMVWHKDVMECVNQLKVGESFTQNLVEFIDGVLGVAGADRVRALPGKPICCFFDKDPRESNGGTYVPIVVGVESFDGRRRYDFVGVV